MTFELNQRLGPKRQAEFDAMRKELARLRAVLGAADRFLGGFSTWIDEPYQPYPKYLQEKHRLYEMDLEALEALRTAVQEAQAQSTGTKGENDNGK